MLARMRAIAPVRADLLVAALFFVEAIVELVVLVPDGAHHNAWAVALILALAGCLATRRRWPVPSAIVAMPLLIGFNLLGKAYGDHMVTPFFVLLFLLYSMGRNVEGRALSAVLAWALVCALIAQAVDSYDDEAASYLFTVGTVVFGPALVGRVVRNRAALNRTLQ